MIRLQDLVQISEYEWEIPRSFRKDMRVPVRIFASRRMLEAVLGDKSLEQAVNAATLPGLVGYVSVMPDVHQGYGFPIGGVAATRYPDGVISPGAIGYDINCGVRLLATRLPYQAAEPFLDDLATALDRHCPSGVGKAGFLRVKNKDLERVCEEGARWALERGFATEEDLRRTEEHGAIARAIEIRGRASKDAVLDVQYEDLVLDPLKEIRRIYDFIGMDLETGVERAMQGWIDANPKNKYGTHHYRLEDFGLDANELEERFEAYRTQFGVEPESS